MRKKLISVLQYVFFLGLGLILLWYTTRNLSDSEIQNMKDSLRNANYLVVILPMLLLFASHYSRALRWKILMEPLGFQPTTLNTFFAVMISYFFNLLVPRLGEVMKCTLLAKYEKTPVDRLIGTMVAERAIDVISLLIVIFLTIVLQIDIVGNYASTELGNAFRARFNPTSIMVLLVILVGLFFLARFVLSNYAHISVIGKVRSILKGIWEGLTSIRYVKRKWAFLFHSIFIWAMYLLSIRMGFYAMQEVAHLGIKPAFTILSFGSLAMIITQGGIGAYQLVVQKSMVLYGIPEFDGLAFGWLLWGLQTLMVLSVGLICLILLPIVNRKPHDANRPHTA
jgi:uncharacterized protein (TIRG00374 family)